MYLLGILIGSSHCLPLLRLVRVTTLELVLQKNTFIKLIGAYYVIPLCWCWLDVLASLCFNILSWMFSMAETWEMLIIITAKEYYIWSSLWKRSLGPSKPLCVTLECIVIFTRADWSAYPASIRHWARRRKTTELVLVKAMDIYLHFAVIPKIAHN